MVSATDLTDWMLIEAQKVSGTIWVQVRDYSELI